MKRLALLLLAALAVGGIAAGAASSRGDDWQPVEVAPFDWSCGATTVHVTPLVNQEYQRLIATRPDGTEEYQITGAVKAEYATDTASVEVNTSGPATVVIHPDGTVEDHARGLFGLLVGPTAAAALGVPSEITVIAGHSDVTFYPDGTVSGHVGNVIQDVCAELGAS